MAAYGEFAKVYDLFMGSKNAGDWENYLYSLLKTYDVLPPKKILDVGCGTGRISLPLIDLGFRVTGIDKSSAMLEQAARNANEKGVFLPLIEADMRELPQCGRVHAVISACDPVNYLEDEIQVAAFFSGAFEKLYPKGVLLFDVCTPYYYQTILADGCFASLETNAAYILQTSSFEKTCRMMLTLFTQQHNGNYIRSEEEHILASYTKENLLSLLYQAGFANCHAYTFGTREDASDTDERWQFVAIRA